MTTNLTQQSRSKLWLAAIKPPMYTVAVIPIIVGTAVAFAQTQLYHPATLAIFLSAAILIIAWLNLSNDVFDSDTGIDVNKAHSVVNLTGNRTLILIISKIFLLLGIAGIVTISWWQQDWTVLGLIILACFLGYTYQGPPFRLGYQGLGEIICFVCFGPLAIAAAYYSQTQSFSWQIMPAAIIIGITTSIILFCSHFHQVEDDLAAGKRSPIVRLGTLTGSKVLTISTLSIFILTIIFILLNYFSWTSLLILASFPFAYQLINHVQQYHDQPENVSNCKFIAVNLHFTSGLLLALGLILPYLTQ